MRHLIVLHNVKNHLLLIMQDLVGNRGMEYLDFELKYPWFAPKMQVLNLVQSKTWWRGCPSVSTQRKLGLEIWTRAFVSVMKKLVLFDVIQSILWRKTLTKEYFS